MATKAQLEEALKRADAAGATEDARALAMALKNRQYETPQLYPGPTDIDVNAVTPAPYGFGREMLSGLTFGYGDELEAALTDTPIEEIRAGQQKYREENPWTAAGASMLGAAPTMIIPGAGLGNLARGIGVGGKLARAAGAVGAGAASGALTGSGEAIEGDRVSGAKQGALIGGAMAPVGAAAGRGLGVVGRTASRGRVRLTPQQKAEATILGAMAGGGTSPTSLIDDLVSGQTLAEQAMPLSDLAGAATRLSPQVKGIASELVETRQATRPEQLRNLVRSEISPEGVMTAGQIEELTARQRAAASPLYERAYQEAGPIASERLSDLMSRKTVQAAYKRAQRIAENAGQTLPDWEAGQPITLEVADQIKKGLDDVVYSGKQPTSSIGKEELASIDRLRGEFVDAVDEVAPPSYKAARAISAGGFRDQEAADLGADAFKKGPEYVSKFLTDPTKSESEKIAFRAGAMADFETRMNKVADSRESFRALVNSQHARDTLQALSTIEGPSALTPLVRRQRAEADFGTQLLGGSQTAGRRAADDALKEDIIPDIPTSSRDFILQAIRGIRDKYRVGDEKAAEVGRILLNPDLQQNRDMLFRLETLENMMRQQAGQRGAIGASGATVGGAQTARED